jgi:hypothetical protein
MTATLAPEGAKVEVPKGPVVEGAKQGLGGREASGEPASSAAKSLNRPKGENRYAVGVDKESDAVRAARKLHGRPTLSEALGINQSTCWRWENGKVQVGEVDAIKAAVAKIATLPAPEPKGNGQASKVKQAQALITRAAEDKAFSKAKLIEELLSIFPIDAS